MAKMLIKDTQNCIRFMRTSLILLKERFLKLNTYEFERGKEAFFKDLLQSQSQHTLLPENTRLFSLSTTNGLGRR